MSRSSQQQTSLNEFFRWESQSWVEVTADLTTDEKAFFMPVSNLKAYFAANEAKKLSKILAEIFKSDLPPIDPELILRDHTAIFCILLRIGRGELIEHFARYEELSDRRLPFDVGKLPTEFLEADEDAIFAMRFCEKQRMYCVPVLDAHMLHKHFGKQRLLPITYKDTTETEGMFEKYVIKIYGPHNRLLPPGQDPQINNTFVLKRYSTKDANEYYNQEVNGFRAVKHAESIIRFYGSYIHGDYSNVLLEFADQGSLEEYFKRETPPSRGLDIIKFWECLFQLIKGLKAIHSVKDGHHSVKPDSILVLSGGAESSSDWQFKFANFGQGGSGGGTPDGGSRSPGQDALTYAPPESYLPYHSDGPTGRSPVKVTWTADIWSLGCIYSEAAMWIADGYKGLLEYRRERMTESDRVMFRAGDCFHDGEKVLQSVLNAHNDIEDRLRRSDYITKDVLESLVEEMLWEDDRPNAKALWRKAEMVSARSRQRLSSNSGDEFSRPGSSQSRSILPPRPPPPTQALPPIPRVPPPGLAPITEQQLPSVERWRSQVTSSRNSRSQFGGTGSDVDSPTLPNKLLSSSARTSNIDANLAGSVASWQLGENSATTSPITPFTSPHVSVLYDFSKQNQQSPTQNEERPAVIRRKPSSEYKIPAKSAARGVSSTSNNDSSASDNASVSSAPPKYPGSYSSYTPEIPDINTMPTSIPPKRSTSIPTKSPANPEFIGGGPPIAMPIPRPAENQTRTPSRAPSKASSRHSSAPSVPVSQVRTEAPSYFHTEDQPRPKSQKRGVGFSLFPNKPRSGVPPISDPDPLITYTRTPTFQTDSSRRSIRSSISGHSGRHTGIDPGIGADGQFEYLSINTCLEWKRAYKKVKKASKIPPLPGASMLQGLEGRDHVFIIDDSAAMIPVWPDVRRVFEALSYTVKGMSPDGTELFYTVSYDTWRRKDTSDLCEYLEKKEAVGVTNICYRLNLQMQAYQAKMLMAKGDKKKKAALRPMSFYILTNGEWDKLEELKKIIKEMADMLVNEGKQEMVTIEFISFAQTAGASQNLTELEKEDFGADIVDCTRWTGNVLKMLKGPLDKARYANDADGALGQAGLEGSVVSELA